MTGALPRYEPLEHTSEAGVIAHGATLAEAFANAAEGMYDLMLDLGGIEERETREIAVTGANHEELLVDWLLELVFLTETANLVFRRFRVDGCLDETIPSESSGKTGGPRPTRATKLLSSSPARRSR